MKAKIIKNVVSGVCGVWYVVYGVWYMVCGLWYGVRVGVSCIKYQVSSIKSQVSSLIHLLLLSEGLYKADVAVVCDGKKGK